MGVRRSLAQQEEYRVRDTDRSADGDREPDRLGSRGHEPGDPGTPEWLENQQRAAAAMSEGVVRSLTEAQRRDLQGEAVGDREPREPVTEAGRQYIEAVSADTWSLDGRVAWARRFVLAIEDEAALLARPVDRDAALEESLADHWTQLHATAYQLHLLTDHPGEYEDCRRRACRRAREVAATADALLGLAAKNAEVRAGTHAMLAAFAETLPDDSEPVS